MNRVIWGNIISLVVLGTSGFFITQLVEFNLEETVFIFSGFVMMCLLHVALIELPFMRQYKLHISLAYLSVGSFLGGGMKFDVAGFLFFSISTFIILVILPLISPVWSECTMGKKKRGYTIK